MSSEPSILDNLRVASPCPKLWSDMEMTPEQSVRFCGDCKKMSTMSLKCPAKTLSWYCKKPVPSKPKAAADLFVCSYTRELTVR